VARGDAVGVAVASSVGGGGGAWPARHSSPEPMASTAATQAARIAPMARSVFSTFGAGPGAAR